MILKEVISVSYSKLLIMLSVFILLTLTQVSSRALEKPVISINNTMIIDRIGISHQNFTANNKTDDINDIISSTRAMRRPTIFIKNGFNPVHKIDSLTFKGSGGSTIFQRMPWTENVNKGYKELATANKSANLAFADMLLSKQSRARQKYPNHSTVYRSIGNNYGKREFGSNEVDYEHQSQEYESDYYSDGSYNTISEEQNDYGNNIQNVEDSVRDPWRISYSLPNMGYFLPPTMTPNINNRPGATTVRDCNCPNRSNRAFFCQNPSANFFNILFALGQNVWALMQFLISRTVPFVVPLIIFKMIIIPLKILKIISLIKFFFKFFIILPIVLRIIFPALFNFLSSPSFFLQNLLGTPLTYSDPRQIYAQRLSNNVESLSGVNGTSALKKENSLSSVNMWDLSECPTRMACELGVLLSTPTDTYFLQKIAVYLTRYNGWMDFKNFNDEKTDDNEKNEDQVQRNDEAFKAFLIALSKRWTKDKCEIYKCSILF